MQSRTRIILGAAAVLGLTGVVTTGASAQSNNGHHHPPVQYAFASATASASCTQQASGALDQLPPATCANSPLSASRTGAIDVAGTVTPASGAKGAALNSWVGLVGDVFAVPAATKVVTVAAEIDATKSTAFAVAATNPSHEAGYEWLCVTPSPTQLPCDPFNRFGTSPFTASQQLVDAGGPQGAIFPPAAPLGLTVNVPVTSGQSSLYVVAGFYATAQLGDCPGQGISNQLPCIGDGTPLAVELAGTVNGITAAAQ